ncbi:putative reverse transcriptase domain-containing protein [Tanacetum coccineum]
MLCYRQIREKVREEYRKRTCQANFRWGLHKSILDRILCMEFTDVAQVADAARNFEILRDRDIMTGVNDQDKRNAVTTATIGTGVTVPPSSNSGSQQNKAPYRAIHLHRDCKKTRGLVRRSADKKPDASSRVFCADLRTRLQCYRITTQMLSPIHDSHVFPNFKTYCQKRTSRIHPFRDVEFNINYSRAEPISQGSLSHGFPWKLKELKDQLQEVVGARFYPPKDYHGTQRKHRRYLVVVDSLDQDSAIPILYVGFFPSVIGQRCYARIDRLPRTPSAIRSDSDPRSRLVYWKGLTEPWGTRLKFSTAFHPETDGQSEPWVRFLYDDVTSPISLMFQGTYIMYQYSEVTSIIISTLSRIPLVRSVKIYLSEEPESILDRQVRVMRKKTIPFVKILWRNHPEREATWETEESIRTSYPHFLP